jgi:hypothetical protein
MRFIVFLFALAGAAGIGFMGLSLYIGLEDQRGSLREVNQQIALLKGLKTLGGLPADVASKLDKAEAELKAKERYLQGFAILSAGAVLAALGAFCAVSRRKYSTMLLLVGPIVGLILFYPTIDLLKELKEGIGGPNDMAAYIVGGTLAALGLAFLLSLFIRLPRPAAVDAE